MIGQDSRAFLIVNGKQAKTLNPSSIKTDRRGVLETVLWKVMPLSCLALLGIWLLVAVGGDWVAVGVLLGVGVADGKAVGVAEAVGGTGVLVGTGVSVEIGVGVSVGSSRTSTSSALGKIRLPSASAA